MAVSKNKPFKRLCTVDIDVILHPDTEEGGFWVECPALQGCVSQGDTEAEALENIKKAIEGRFEILTPEIGDKS